MYVPVATAPPGYLTINEAARILDVSPWRVAEMARDNEVKAITFIEAADLLKRESA